MPLPFHSDRRATHDSPALQAIAIAACILYGLAMILNNQMGGEGMWFWYDYAFLHGAKVYSQLHFALQPFYLLESAAWMRLVGQNLIALESLSLLHIAVMTGTLYLILRESTWPGWLKAITLFSAFAFTVGERSYRFDDYHIVTEDFIFLSLLLMLWITRTRTPAQELRLAGFLGLLSGFTITTRVTDGAALISAVVLCLLLLPLRRRWLSIGFVIVAASVTVWAVVALTGDSFAAYLENSLFRAAGSKGGTSHIFATPLIGLVRSFSMVDKHVLVPLLLILAIGPAIYYFWRKGLRYIVPIELGVTALLLCVVPRSRFQAALMGSQVDASTLVLGIVMYALPIVVLLRWAHAKRTGGQWDPRELLVLLPLAERTSYMVGAGGNPLGNYYAPIPLLLVLVAVLDPFPAIAAWFLPDFAVFMLLIAISSVTNKAILPYSWENYTVPPMFQNRAIYHHPVYGWMYIDKDLLRFSEEACSIIGAEPGRTHPELLSLPFPTPSYFCNIPPWHSYIQTFFDISTHATIDHMMQELNTDPPQYIAYQRQLLVMTGAEHYYNHDQPIPQRFLDQMIMNKLETGQWKLLEFNRYLYLYPGDGWYIIQTHP